jgi:ribosomal protein S9
MFNTSNSSVTVAVTVIGSGLSGSATAVVIAAAGGTLHCVLRETLPYIERAVHAFPDWRSRLLDTRWQRVVLRDRRRRLRAGRPLLPSAEREDARSEVAPDQMSFGQEPASVANDMLMSERWVASNPRAHRRASG